MARPKNNRQVIDSIEGALPQGLEGDLNAINEHRQLIMAQFGEGLPYDRNRIVHEAKFYMAQSAGAMLDSVVTRLKIIDNRLSNQKANVS